MDKDLLFPSRPPWPKKREVGFLYEHFLIKYANERQKKTNVE